MGVSELWALWYSLVALGWQCFLVWRAASRCALFNAAPWPRLQTSTPSPWESAPSWPHPPAAELYAYVAMTASAALLVPLQAAVTCLRCAGTRGGSRSKKGAWSAGTWTAGAWIPPAGPLVHLMAASLLMIPEIFLQAAEIKHRVKSEG